LERNFRGERDRRRRGGGFDPDGVIAHHLTSGAGSEQRANVDFGSIRKILKMDVESHFRSLTAELEALKGRVGSFIDKAHWLTDGEWKESILRSFLTRRLPDTVKVGRGFVLTKSGLTTQCDILLYKASSPILFRDGELVILTPDAVLGIIEVKSRANRATLESALEKFAAIGRKLGRERSNVLFGLFSYENDINDVCVALRILRDKCDHEAKIVDLLNLGCSTFIKWWRFNPESADSHYEKWHSYDLPDMAAGYFIANVVEFVSPDSVGKNNWLWFPESGKESKKTAEIAFGHALNS
jgi:hypothetical protein